MNTANIIQGKFSNRGYYSLFVFIIAELITAIGYAQVIQSIGPYDTNVRSLLTDGTLLYAATFDGVAVSSDNGFTWSYNSQQYSKAFNLTSLAECNSIIFAGSSNSQIYKSTDQGLHWYSVAYLPTGDSIYALGSCGSNVYACTDSGVYLTDSYGEYWGLINQGLTIKTVKSFASVNNDIFIGTGAGIYHSTDQGYQWFLSDSSVVNTLLIYNNKIYAGTNGSGILVSDNLGKTWINIGPNNSAIYSIAIRELNIAAVSDSGIILTTDNGLNWIPGGLKGVQVNTLFSTGKSLLAGTNYSGGLFRSIDDGATWSLSNNGFSKLVIYSLFASGDSVFTGGDSYGLFLSSDYGNSWSQNNNGLTDRDILTLGFNGSKLYAGTANHGVFISSNRGTDWYPSITPFNNIHPRCFGFFDSTIFMGTDSGIYSSTNNGLNWTNSGPKDLPDISSLAFIRDYVFACSYTAFYRSSDKGTTWKHFPDSQNYYCLKVDGDSLYAGTGNGIFISTDFGITWHYKISQQTGCSKLFIKHPYILAAGQNVYLSKNDGISWNIIFDNKDNISPYSYALSDSFFFIGTYGNGIYRLAISDFITGIKNNSIDIPQDFSLYQNYPNPFNPSTIIKYSIPVRGNVRLTIFNTLGEAIKVLVNETMGAGYHSVSFNGDGFASGVYIYSLQVTQANGQIFRSARKMILIK